MHKPRICVIGAGVMGRTHINLVHKEPGCALAAVADPCHVPETLALLEKISVPFFNDHKKMLDEVKPDGVIVVTPNHLHVPVALDCLERGALPLVEKPVAESWESGLELAEAADKSGLPVLVGQHRRHDPQIIAAREYIAAGKLGRITAVLGSWLCYKPDDYYDIEWRRQKGAGPILVNLVHDVDSLRHLVGEVSAVCGFTSNSARGFEIENSAVIALQFANGAVGSIVMSDSSCSPYSWELTARENQFYPNYNENCYCITGSEGSLAVPSMDVWRYAGKKDWGSPLTRERIKVVLEPALERQLRHFIRLLTGEDKEPLTSVRDGLATVALLDNLRRAAQSGQTVRTVLP